MKKTAHISVLLQEVLEAFEGKKLGVFFEGTVGAGGHAGQILKAHPEIEQYIACDQDENALEIAQENLKPYAEKITFIHANFSELKNSLRELNLKEVNGFFLT